MKNTILIILILFSTICVAQDKLLTKKIVYKVKVTDNAIKSSEKKDSVAYNYLVNKRFFWEAMDALCSDLQKKKLYLQTFTGDTIVWDTMINRLSRQLEKKDLRKYSKKDIQAVLENEIRAIKFWEEWTYDTQTMLINKKIIAFCPIIERDSIALLDEDLQAKESFSFEMGWIMQNSKPFSQDILQICRNIQYTMPIYNTKPYFWWERNLEAEYSIPFFDMLDNKTISRQVLCYDSPDTPEAYSKAELDKRHQHTVTTTIISDLPDNNITETDTTITLSYKSEDIDYLRFGEEINYDKQNHNFTKIVNYYAPVVRIFATNGQFRGYYPLYYIRKK